MFCSVITPTYNRANLLASLHASLCQQKDPDLEWIVADDGSTDGTAAAVEKLRRDSPFPVTYLYQENAGKHTAVNAALAAARAELCLILDSDDKLTPDAISLIKEVWSRYSSNKKICGLSFHAQDNSGRFLGDQFPEDFYLSDHNRCRIQQGCRGDKCEVFRTEILKAFPFPVFPGESFIVESIVWGRIADHYQTVYVNRTILIKTYLPGGISASAKQAQLRSPQGSTLAAREMLQRPFSWGVKCKFMLQYTCYSIKSGLKAGRILQDSGCPWLCAFFLPAGALLCWYWSRKYDRI